MANPSFPRGTGGGSGGGSGGATLVKPNVNGFSRDNVPTAEDYYDDGVSGDYSPMYDDGQGFQQPSALGFRSDVLPLSGRVTPRQRSFFGDGRFNKDYYTKNECGPANCRFPKICDKGICRVRSTHFSEGIDC